jgi:hypothetical protein
MVSAPNTRNATHSKGLATVRTTPSGSAQFECSDEFDMQRGIGGAVGSLSARALICRSALLDNVGNVGQSGPVSERESRDEGHWDRSLADECAMYVFRSSSNRQGAMTVRLTHRPTGVVAESSGGRSQLENLNRALEALRDLLDGR